jgi:hypothetical protein
MPAEDYSQQHLEADNDLAGNPALLAKLSAAAAMANRTLRSLVPKVVVGASVATLCLAGDARIARELAAAATTTTTPSMDTDMEEGEGEGESDEEHANGIAFPTCITLNSMAACNRPAPGSEADQVLALGDLAKIQLGVHVDGYVAMVTHTLVVGAGATGTPVVGRPADVVCAAYHAAEAAARMLRVGASRTAIQYMIHQIAAAFGCLPTDTSSFLMKRYLPEYGPLALQAPWTAGASPAKADTPTGALMVREPRLGDSADQEVEEGVYDLHISMTTGPTPTLSPQSSLADTMLLVRDPAVGYNLKLKASRLANTAATEAFGVFPFAAHTLLEVGGDKSIRLGIQECLRQGHFLPKPLLKSTGLVAAYQCTVVVGADGEGRRLTGGPSVVPAPYVHSAFSLAHIEGLAELLATPMPHL